MEVISFSLWLAEKFVPLQGKKQLEGDTDALSHLLWLAEKFVPLQGKKQPRVKLRNLAMSCD